MNAIKEYWNAIIKIIIVARENYDSYLSFNSQRKLISLILNIINNPLYENEKFQALFAMKSMQQAIYELARYQNLHDKKGIDLFLKCEIISQLNQFEKKDYFISTKGTVDLYQTLIDIFKIICSDKPQYILDVYRNIVDFRQYSKDIKTEFTIDDQWILGEISEINRACSKISFDDYHNLNNKFNKIKNHVEKSRNDDSEDEIEKYLNDIKNKLLPFSIYNRSLKKHRDYISLKILAILAYYERWDEIIKIVNWKNPEESEIINIGNSLVSNEINTLYKIYKDNYDKYLNDNQFIDNHVLVYYIKKALEYIFFKKRNIRIQIKS